jgi:hypothetical protein
VLLFALDQFLNVDDRGNIDRDAFVFGYTTVQLQDLRDRLFAAQHARRQALRHGHRTVDTVSQADLRAERHGTLSAAQVVVHSTGAAAQRCVCAVQCAIPCAQQGERMSDCPRMLTKEQMIAGLKAGRRLRVDRRDAPELPELLELQDQGLVTSRLIEVDEQYSYAEFTWCGHD